MDVSGSYKFSVPRERVWQALLDPAVLRRVVPGCEALEQVEDGTYKGRVRVGIAAVKGTYEGTLRLKDLQPPAACTITADGKGPRGVIHGEGSIHFEAAADTTTLITYTGTAQLGGPIATVGTRVVGAAANLLIRSVFAALADVLDDTSFDPRRVDEAKMAGDHPDVQVSPATVGKTPAVQTRADGIGSALESASAELRGGGLPKGGASSHPALSTMPARSGPPRDPVVRLVRRLRLSDGSRESERRWARRIALSGLSTVATVVALVAFVVARLKRR
jgi:carbon monoxide dehydrogenase subunit G